jgi:TATA-box binding protein (TBP) (component of TFIID and TFIIIB)
MMDVRITNVVLSANLSCILNLNDIARYTSNVTYNRKKYSGLIWHHRHIKSKCFLFHTGRMMCMGNAGINNAKKDLRMYARLLSKMGYKVTLNIINVVTKSAVATLGGKLNVKDASITLNGLYEPELFMALMFRRKSVHFTCFASGKVIMTGVKKLSSTFTVLAELEMFTL